MSDVRPRTVVARLSLELDLYCWRRSLTDQIDTKRIRHPYTRHVHVPLPGAGNPPFVSYTVDRDNGRICS